MSIVASLTVDKIRAVLDRMSDEGDTTKLVGAFADYPGSLSTAVRFGVIDARAQVTADHLHNVLCDVWNIGIILERLEWTRAECIGGRLDESAWTYFAQLEVEQFHVEMRSAMDYVSQAICSGAARRGQAGAESFETLRNWVQKPNNRKRLGEDLAALVDDAVWFPAIRKVRDHTVHKGAAALVFRSASEGVHFQVRTGFASHIIEPELAINHNGVLDFHLYAATLLTHLLDYLERVCTVIRVRLPLPEKHLSGGWISCSGFTLYRAWAAKLIELLEQRSEAGKDPSCNSVAT